MIWHAGWRGLYQLEKWHIGLRCWKKGMAVQEGNVEDMHGTLGQCRGKCRHCSSMDQFCERSNKQSRTKGCKLLQGEIHLLRINLINQNQQNHELILGTIIECQLKRWSKPCSVDHEGWKIKKNKIVEKPLHYEININKCLHNSVRTQAYPCSNYVLHNYPLLCIFIHLTLIIIKSLKIELG